MSKQSLLLVDGDTRSLRVLEVSLRKSGFAVTPTESTEAALALLNQHVPDLVISETTFPTGPDGFSLRERVRAIAGLAEVPFVFLTAETTLESKIRGLELGVDDYLTKPIYIKEVVARINILLHKRQRAQFDKHKDGTQFSGHLADMPVVDVIQTIEVSRKSGVIHFVGGHQRVAAIYFRDGKVIDAEAGTLQGEDAVYRLLTWTEGEFEVVFRTVRRREVISIGSQGLLMEGMRRLDEWTRLQEQLPPLTHRFEVDTKALAGRLDDVPDDNNQILRLFDGNRSLLDVIYASNVGDLECLQAISSLYFEGLLIERATKSEAPRPATRAIEHHGATLASAVMSQTELGSFTSTVDDVAAASPPAADPRHDNKTEAVNTESAESAGALRLIEEAVAAAQAHESPPVEFPAPHAADRKAGRNGAAETPPKSAEEASIPPEPPLIEVVAAPTAESRNPLPITPSVAAAIARVPLAVRQVDPRIATARVAVERIASRERKSSSSPESSKLPESASSNRPPSETSGASPVAPLDGVPAAPLQTDDSAGLRMIGSLGRERATAVGEVSHRQPPSRSVPPERELLTILPRRVSRMHEVATVRTAETPGSGQERSPSESRPETPRIPVVEGVRRKAGPGPMVVAAIILAGCLLGVAMTVHWGSASRQRGALVLDAAMPTYGGVLSDAPPSLVVQPAHVGSDSPVARVDAASTVGQPDAVAQPAEAPQPGSNSLSVEAAVPPAPPDAKVVAEEKVNEARRLFEAALNALEVGDANKAAALAIASLKLRKTARTYLVHSRAMNQLGQLDAALDSVESALQIVPAYGPAWELRGRILWAAGRRPEARLALRRYLELDPTGRGADAARQMLSEP